MNHLGDTNKMVSDTPRTETYVLNPLPQVVSAEWARQLERELNAANAEIERLTAKVAQLYEGAEEQKQRIKRLEKDSERLQWLLDRGLAWRDCYDEHWIKGEWLYASQDAIETIDKAKEDKL